VQIPLTGWGEIRWCIGRGAIAWHGQSGGSS